MKRILTLFVALSLLTALMSCGGGTQPSQVETTAGEADAADGAITTIAETADPLADNLPEADFDGRKFRVVTSDEYAYQIYAEEETGDVTNDAIFRRNLTVEERFGFEVESLINSAGKFQWYPPIVATVLAGEDAYDLVGHYAYNAHVAISGGAYLNWKDIPDIDLDRVWWNSEINDRATFNGKLFAVTGYLATTVMQSTYAIFVNTRLAGNYGYDLKSLYGMVEDGEWVIDKFTPMMKDMYVDLNGDGARDKDDQYGYGSMPDNSLDFWLAAFDQPITSRDKDTIKIEIMTDKTVSALNKLLDFYYNNEGVINYETVTAYVSNYGHDRFAAGLTVFAPSFFSAAYDMYRDMDDDYGILPIPKWDEKQDKHFTHIMDKYTIWGTPVTIGDTEFVGIVTEALCAESYRSVYPVFYDTALKAKYSTDAATADMVDLIMDGVTFDLGFMFGEYLGKVQTMIREHIKTNNPDFASDYASRVFKIDELNSFYE